MQDARRSMKMTMQENQMSNAPGNAKRRQSFQQKRLA